MKAVWFERHGGPEVLVQGDMADPVPGPGQALVRVEACAVNRLDIWRRSGVLGADLPLPHVPGLDVAGVVEAVGPAVGRGLVGLETLVAPGLTCGACSACAAGLDSRCAEGMRVVGNQLPGGYAELVVVPARNCLPRPEGLDAVEAAALPTAYLTAYHMVVTRGATRPGETALVLAAGSGVGAAAVQIAVAVGARVIAAAGTDEKIERAIDIGAESGIVYEREDVADRARDLAGGAGVDVVIDPVGEATFVAALASLARGGRLVLCGTTTGSAAAFDIRDLFSRELTIAGAYLGSRSELLELLRLVRDGRVRAVIDRTYSLAQAADAHRRMESREHFGKIVLTV
jgi:NADPH:quinone reductase-like Zn-dependent oxidoreductase